MPLALIEAMSSGLAVISTDMPTTRKLVCDGKSGYIVRKKSTEDITLKLADYIEGGAGIRQTHGNFARKTALHFTWRKAALKYITVYNSIKV